MGMVLVLLSCKKEVVYRNGAPGELPAETQTGAGTFGCLVNGKVWKPAGGGIGVGTSNLDLSYDPTFNGGTMSIKAYRYRDSSNINILENVSIAISQLSKVGVYSMDNAAQNAVGEYAYSGKNKTTNEIISFCQFNPYSDKRTGSLTITKIDLTKGFISGRFEFTLTKTNPDSDCISIIKVTDGRFDLKM
jgi:hypothetical protein